MRGEQLIAFYHFASDRLVVRKTLSPALLTMGEAGRSFILAHEVGHVLQDQQGLGTWCQPRSSSRSRAAPCWRETPT